MGSVASDFGNPSPPCSELTTHDILKPHPLLLHPLAPACSLCSPCSPPFYVCVTDRVLLCFLSPLPLPVFLSLSAPLLCLL